MAERGSVCVGSDSIQDIFCELCFEDGKHIKAEGFCTSCVDYLCSDCVIAHKKNKASKTHAILEKGDMPENKPKLILNTGVKDESFVEKCDHHPNEFVKYYCRTHTCVGCHVCITIDHRLCEGVVHIPDAAEDILDSKEQNELQKKLDDLKSKSHNVLKLSRFNMKNAEKMSKMVNNVAQQICVELRDAVKMFEESIKSEVETLKTMDLSRLEDVGNKCNRVLSEIEKSASDLQSLQKDKQFTQLFIMMKKVNGRIQAWGKSLDEANSINTVSAYHVKSSSLVQQIVDKPNLLGKVTVTFDGKCKDIKLYDNVPNQTYLQPKPGQPPVNRAAKPKLYIERKPLPLPRGALKAKNTESQAKNTEIQDKSMDGAHTEVETEQEELIAEHLHDITVKCKGESSHFGSHITSSVIVSDKLVVVDSAHNKLLVINMDSKIVVSGLSLQSRPWDVTSISPQKIVVTLPKDEKIMFVRLTNADTLVVDKNISVGGCCRGIVLCEEKLIVSFSEFRITWLEILNLNGECEKKLVLDDSRWNMRDLAAGPDGTVFVLDLKDRCVKCISLDGTVTVKYKNMMDAHDHLLSLAVLDQHGRVALWLQDYYFDSSYVVLLEEDGIKPLLEQIPYPERRAYSETRRAYSETISHCKRTDRLYIHFDSTISVYQLSRSPVVPQ